MIDNLVCPKCGSVRIYVTHPAKYAIEAYQPKQFDKTTNLLKVRPDVTYAERMGFGKAYDTKVFCEDCGDVLYLEEREW